MNLKLLIRKPQKISVTSLISFLLFFTLVNIEYINSPIYTLAEYFFLLAAILYVIRYLYIISRKEYWTIFFVAAIGVCIFVSACVNRIESYYIRAALYYGIKLVVLFYYLLILAHRKQLEFFLKSGKLYLTIVLLLNDLLMVLLPNIFYNIRERDIGTCLLGNKFSVAYAHMLYIFIVCCLERDNKVRLYKAIALTVLMSVLCVYIDCITAMLAMWIFLFLLFLGPRIQKIMSRTSVFVFAFFLASVLLLIFSEILSFGPLRWFVVDVLHRDPTLTGRMEVFPFIFILVPSHKWLGYGYGTSIVKTTSIWYANVQNAFWDFIIRYGMVTMIFLAFLIICIVRKQHKEHKRNQKNKNDLWLCMVMLYVYVFMGIGEIVYGIYFFLYLAILNAVCYESKQM